MPQRIQRSRAKGWRKPEDAVIVDRTSRWGNPFTVAEHGRTEAVVRHRHALLAGCLPPARPGLQAVTVDDVRRFLVGRDLVCVCPLDAECHADILLEVANP